MVQVKWTDQAIEDLDNIAAYIAKDSYRYAVEFIKRIFKRAEILETQPHYGRIVPEIGDKSIRQLILGNYRIIYKIINEERIDILTVHHSARLLSNSPLFE